MTYVLEEKMPSADEYYLLRSTTGLTPPLQDSIVHSLQNTWYGITIRLQSLDSSESETEIKDEAVAIGRIVGDGAIFLQVCDVCIKPKHQRQGLGEKVMRALVAYVDLHAPNAHLSLLADPSGVGLYERVGFEKVVNTPMVRAPYFQGDEEGIGHSGVCVKSGRKTGGGEMIGQRLVLWVGRFYSAGVLCATA